MDSASLILSFLVGVGAAIGAGAMSGLRIDAEDIGSEMSALQGGLFGLASGSVSVAVIIMTAMALHG